MRTLKFYIVLGTCCRLCSNGPCRITPDSPKGVCGATADSIVARNFLRAISAGAACYLHVAESTARRLKNIASGKSPLKLRSPEFVSKVAGLLNIETNGSVNKNAEKIADAVLSDLYNPRYEEMKLVKSLVVTPRIKNWEKTGIMPGGAKSEVFDALVKTSANLNTDPVDQLLHSLKLGIATGIYGLALTNLMNDIIMGEPEITKCKTGFSVIDEDYVNIAVTGHSHSVFAGLIDYLETEEAQSHGIKAGAKGIKIIGLTCVGQDMQLRGTSVKSDVFAGQAGNNFTQEAALATGGIDMLISEFNCTLSGIEPIAAEMMVKLVCLDDVSKQSAAEMISDIHGKEDILAKKLVRIAVDQYIKRRKFVKIDIPEHGFSDVITGISENSLVGFLGGNLKPLIELLTSGKIKGIAGILGCSNLAAGGHDITTVALTKELIKKDILILSAGCTTGGLANVGLCSPDAKELAGDGLKSVCTELGIPPVLNFGPCLAIGRIELLVSQLAKTLDTDIPALPVAISAPQWLEEQALADGCFGLALGLPLHLSQPPPISGSRIVTEILTDKLTEITGGKVIVESEPVKAADKITEIISQKAKALGIG